MTYTRIVLRFRDIEDPVNHRCRIRTFWSPLFDASDEEQRNFAIEEVSRAARACGFTPKELIGNAKIMEVQSPVAKPEENEP